MTRCPSPTHKRDVRHVAGCLSCGAVRAVKDTREGKTPARRAAEADSNARTRRIPREIFARVNEACDAVQDDPTLAPAVNAALAAVLGPR